MNEKNTRDRWFLGTLARLLVTGQESGGKMTVVEQLAPKGFSPPLHVHETEDSMICVVTGEITVQIGDRQSTLGPGQAGFLPKGVPHTFRIDSETARLIEVTTPGGFDRFVEENSVPAAELALPERPPAIDPAALGASAARHGAPLVGPPLMLSDVTPRA